MTYFISYSYVINSVMLFENCMITYNCEIKQISDIEKIEYDIWNDLCNKHEGDDIPDTSVVIMNFQKI